MPDHADAIIIGAGLAGLVTAAELVEAGKRVVIVEQEPEASFGGQAHWSFGGLFLVDTPEQRRLGVHDSHELARQDWFGSAEFDRAEDDWAREWAEAYLAFAASEKRDWLAAKGVKFFPDRRLGRSVAGTPRPGTATRCRASTSSGAPAPACSSRSSRPCSRASTRGSSSCGSGTGSTS